jgi:hypothetical protein
MTNPLDDLTHMVSSRWGERDKNKTIAPVNEAALAEYRLKLLEEPTQVQKTEPKNMTPDDVINLIQGRGNRLLSISGNKKGVFSLSPSERSLYGLLLLYFTNDPRFEKYGEEFSLSKCLMLRGDVGCGKTTALTLLATTRGHLIHDFTTVRHLDEVNDMGWGDGFTIAPYKVSDIVPAQKMEDTYRDHGDEGLLRWLSKPDEKKNRELVIDDFGNEEFGAKHFGNPKNVLEFIMNDRHKLWYDRGVKTHLTTNITSGEEIERKYGKRLRSRLREMFNVIDWVDGDKR